MTLQALLTIHRRCFDQRVESLTIFGIDPGTRVLGFGWIEVDASDLERVLSRGCGVIEASSKTASENAVPARLALILRELTEVFAQRRPSVVVVEKVFLGKNVDSAFVLGQARGIVLAVASAAGALVFEVAAKTAKKSVTGSGASEKTEVRLVLGRILGMSEELDSLPLDASDGLALAYQGWRSMIADDQMKKQTGAQI
ncbi:crossover junction endodeoxyribonuclease RuvC [soil metagenome]